MYSVEYRVKLVEAITKDKIFNRRRDQQVVSATERKRWSEAARTYVIVWTSFF